MTQLIIMRHGHAGFDAPSDAERPLSALGRAQVARVGQRLAASLSQLSLVWVSPYLRAQQTLESLGPWIPSTALIETQPVITPSGNPQDVLALLYGQHVRLPFSSMLVVSHLPLVGELIDSMCGLPLGLTTFPTAGVVAVEMDVIAESCGGIQWEDKQQ